MPKIGRVELYALAGVVAAYVVYRGAMAAKDKAGEMLDALNPFSNDNIINKGATSVYRDLTGSTGSIGTDIYDVTHAGGALENLSWWQLMNPGAAVGGVIGNSIGKNWSLGTQIYDWTH